MNTKKLAATVFITALLPLIGLAQVQTAPDVEIWSALTTITNWLFGILIVVAVIFLILAAFNFITAGGDPEKVGTARSQVMYAIIGLIVAILARGLVNWICTTFGGGCNI